MKSFEYAAPGTLGEVGGFRAGQYVHKAGGMDLVDLMKSGIAQPERVISLHAVRDLREIAVDDAGATIGALATLAQLAAHAGLRGKFTALAQAAGEAATPHVRNVATIAGNLLQRPRCWYFRSPEFTCMKKGGSTCHAIDGENKFHAIFDTGPCVAVHPSNVAVALVALNAFVKISSPRGETTMPVEKLFIPPSEDVHREHRLASDELITHIVIPAANVRSAYLEFRERQSFDWALVSAASAVSVADGAITRARVVLGSVASRPWVIESGPMATDEKSLEKFAADALAQARPLAQNRYKIPMARVAIKRCLRAALESGS